MKQSLFVHGLAATAAAFTSPAPTSRPETALFGGAQGMASTLKGKKETVAQVKELLDASEMIFTVPAFGITVSQVQGLRRSLPEGTTVKVIKNKLMRRAIQGTDYESAGGMLQGANMWFFIEEDIGASVKSFTSFVKDEGLGETHSLLGGVVDGTSYDGAGVAAISKLPSKLDLIATIAARVNAVPTKVARVIKAPGMKVARAFKLATEEEEGEDN